MHIVKDDEQKTTCVTQYRSFEFLVMPFVLNNTSTTFCNLINVVFHEYIDFFVVGLYLDDICSSEFLEDYLCHL